MDTPSGTFSTAFDPPGVDIHFEPFTNWQSHVHPMITSFFLRYVGWCVVLTKRHSSVGWCVVLLTGRLKTLGLVGTYTQLKIEGEATPTPSKTNLRVKCLMSGASLLLDR